MKSVIFSNAAAACMWLALVILVLNITINYYVNPLNMIPYTVFNWIMLGVFLLGILFNFVAVALRSILKIPPCFCCCTAGLCRCCLNGQYVSHLMADRRIFSTKQIVTRTATVTLTYLLLVVVIGSIFLPVTGITVTAGLLFAFSLFFQLHYKAGLNKRLYYAVEKGMYRYKLIEAQKKNVPQDQRLIVKAEEPPHSYTDV